MNDQLFIILDRSGNLLKLLAVPEAQILASNEEDRKRSKKSLAKIRKKVLDNNLRLIQTTPIKCDIDAIPSILTEMLGE